MTKREGGIIGAFYFSQSKSGNLNGEFTNNGLDGTLTESSDKKDCFKHKFIGNYDTTWFENGIVQHMELSIIIKENSNSMLYELNWKTTKGVNKFNGVGFISGKKLIGYYTDWNYNGWQHSISPIRV